MSQENKYTYYTTTALVLGGMAVTFLVGQAMFRRRKPRSKTASSAAAAAEGEQRPISTTWLVSSETVVKADPAQLNFPDEPKELRESISEVDEWLCRSSHWLGFCYRFDAVLQEDQVREGLQRTLAHIPALGARVDRNTNPVKYEFVLSPDNQGVVMEVFHGSVAKGSRLPDESNSREEWKQAGLDAPAADFEGEPGPNDPLMRTRLIIFEAEGVSYLSIGISHGLGDGHSITDILQTWSHFCTSKSANGLPKMLRMPRFFGKRVTNAMRPARDMAELEQRVKSDVGCDVNPLSKWAFYGHVLPRAIWTMSRQRVLELRISGKSMGALKAAVMDTLPNKEDWVSRFEVLCAALFIAQRETAKESAHASEQHNLHVACNLRGRISRFPNDYFGNAAFDYCKRFHLPGKTIWKLENLTKVSQEIHTAIRAGLADPENITKTKDWFEAARHLGLKNTYDIWPIIFDTLKGSGTFVNSWGSRWLDISMGAQQEARAFHAYFGMAANLFVEVPRDRKSGDTTIYLALPPKHAERFIEFCQRGDARSPPLPFSIVT